MDNGHHSNCTIDNRTWIEVWRDEIPFHQCTNIYSLAIVKLYKYIPVHNLKGTSHAVAVWDSTAFHHSQASYREMRRSESLVLVTLTARCNQVGEFRASYSPIAFRQHRDMLR